MSNKETTIANIKIALSEKLNETQILDRFNLSNITLAVYDNNDNLVSFVHSKDFTEELEKKMDKDTSSDLSYVYDIVHILRESYKDNYTKGIEDGCNYLADIIIMLNSKKVE